MDLVFLQLAEKENKSWRAEGETREESRAVPMPGNGDGLKSMHGLLQIMSSIGESGLLLFPLSPLLLLICFYTEKKKKSRKRLGAH